ncbi:chymotrypsin BII-like [Cylas formicarius]|uniref:chymotrypsin BII-like n=1 Tax=Cylas formicarius TaxID=197179 RepID=UPI002958ABE2|nr:chymotrypsin BII-like [Cylas formicarius]
MFVHFALFFFAVCSLATSLPSRPAPSPRIIGGHDVAPFSIPYQAIVFSRYDDINQWGGGVLVSSSFVLAAAFVILDVYGETTREVDVFLGVKNFSSELPEPSRQLIKAEQWWIHDDDVTPSETLALVKLSTPAVLNEYVGLPKLPTNAFKNSDFVGSSAVISGFGYTASDELPGVIQVAELPIVAMRKCEEYFGVNKLDNDLFICGYEANANRGANTGDQGGPLTIDGVLYGITYEMAGFDIDYDYQSLFLNLWYFKDWIEQTSEGAVVFA